MPELLSLQRDVAAALHDETLSSRAEAWLAGDPATIEARLSIYRANAAASATKALRGVHPVLLQVVGDDYFDALARAYRRAAPPVSGDLTDYGDGFGDFLAGFAPTRTMPYLPDLARLEWAVHRAYGAADAPAWDPASLAALPPEAQAAARLRWAPGMALLRSAYPAARIWQIHQPGYDGDFSVDWAEPQVALVARNGWQVEVTALQAGEAAFVAASLAGSTLAEAVDAACAADGAFDPGRLLAHAAGHRHLCGHDSERSRP